MLSVLCKQYGVSDNIKSIDDDGTVVLSDIRSSRIFGLVKEFKKIDFLDAVMTISNRIVGQSTGEDEVSKMRKAIALDAVNNVAMSDANMIVSQLASAASLVKLPKQEKKGPSPEELKAQEEKKKQQEAEKQKKLEEQKKQQEEAKKKKEEEQRNKQQNNQQQKAPETYAKTVREYEENGQTVREISQVPMSQLIEKVKNHISLGGSIDFTD